MTIPLFSLTVYSFTLWFGLYLLARDRAKAGLRYAGLGLVSYAFAIAIALLLDNNALALAWSYLPILLPSIFWMGAILYLVPNVPIEPVNQLVFLIMVVLIVLTLGAAIVRPESTWFVGLGIPVVFLVGILVRLRQAISADIPRPPVAILVTATIFFGLATGLVILPVGWFRQEWVILAISLDLVCLGYVVGVLDAYDEGTDLFRDALRSLAASTLAVLIFGGQIIMVMAITEDTSPPMLVLLFGVISTLLVAIIFHNEIQSLLDSLIFTREDVRSQRETFRAASSGIARTATPAPLAGVDDKEFNRWTRRALSHYGDLNKLASSPLLQLPLVDDHAGDDNILSRANALKTLLRDGIDQLKPEDDLEFAPTDEWRYYNVLYFPYIAGLKPYSSRFYRDDLTQAESEALQWFRTYVPERTLYNWQKTAAELVADHLKTRL